VGAGGSRSRPSRRPRGPIWRAGRLLVVPTVVTVVLLSPLLFTHRAFAVDFSNHLWLALQQQKAFNAGTWPTYFVHSDRTGPFYPIFAFYGGGGYALLGAAGAVLGNHMNVADALSWALGFAMAFGGLSWLAWQAGLRGWRVHVPGLVFVTSAYYLTNMYGRGDWAEFMTTSAIPLVAASALWLLRAPRWRVLPVLAFAGGTITLTGIHNITVLWAATFLPFMAVIAGCAFWPAPRSIPARRYAQVIGLAVLATMVNAWYLLPDLAYAGQTAIGQMAHPFFPGIPGHWFNTPGEIFSPLRPTAVPQLSPSLYVQLPVFVIAWVAAGLLVAWRRLVGPARRLVVGLGVLAVGFVVLLLSNRPWYHLPKPWQQTQFAYRVTTYVVLIVAAFTILVLVLLARVRPAARRVTAGALAVALAIGAGTAVWQVWSSKSALRSRDAAYTPTGVADPGWYDLGAYGDQSGPRVAAPPGRTLVISAAHGPTSTLRLVVDPPSGLAPILTNLRAGTNFIELRGLVPVGIAERPPNGVSVFRRLPQLVVRRPTTRLTGPVQIEITSAAPAPVVLGRVASLGGVVGLALLMVALAVSERRRRVRRAGGRRTGISRAGSVPAPELGAP